MGNGRKMRRVIALAGLGLATLAPSARAASTYTDLTQAGQVELNNAWFFVNDDHDANPSAAFVRIQDHNNNGIESGYNNNGPVSADTKSGSYLLKLSQIPVVQYQGNSYFRFLLDVGEPASASKKTISLDDLKLYSFPMTPGNDTKAFGQESGFTLRFHIDTNTTDNDLKLSDRSNGQGKNDLVALIPTFYSADDQWVMLYSAFGNQAKAEGSFEAWKIGTAQVVPEPTMLLLPAGALLMLARRRRKA
jgi:hypothetical protein